MVGKGPIRFTIQAFDIEAQGLKNRGNIGAGESVAGIEDNFHWLGHGHLALNRSHVLVNHVEVLINSGCAGSEGFRFDKREQVLDLLPGQSQLAVSHFDAVIAGVEVAACDHDTGAISGE